MVVWALRDDLGGLMGRRVVVGKWDGHAYYLLWY
jgi:hypothetical protein